MNRWRGALPGAVLRGLQVVIFGWLGLSLCAEGGPTPADTSPLAPRNLPLAPVPPAVPLFGSPLSDPSLPVVTNVSLAAPEPHATVETPGHVAAEVTSPATPQPAAAGEADAAHPAPALEAKPGTPELPVLQAWQTRLSLSRQFRRDRDFESARSQLLELLQSTATEELRRAALFELALVEQDAEQFQMAQRLFAQYINQYPQDPAVPEVLLRQGLLYRRIGATGLAIAKFYNVMTAALNLKMDRVEYYERLVLQAQVEIADTHYQEARFAEAAEFLTRLLKRESPHLNKAQIHYKLIRCLARLDRPSETISQSQRFLENSPDTPEVPEVRFILASTLKHAGRGTDAQRQVLLLLEAQRTGAGRHPELWTYWQKRAGNEIANQFYLDGDYQTTLNIYQHLADLDAAADWQLPVLYQVGLVYERLLQPRKAAETYGKILNRQTELAATNLSPSLKSVLDMARWRKEALQWLDQAQSNLLSLRSEPEP